MPGHPGFPEHPADSEHERVGRLHERPYFSYSESNSAAYFSFTTLRLTFSVGVSSPISCERSWSRIVNFLICSTWAYFALARSRSAWISSRTFGSFDSEAKVCRQPLLLGPGHDLLLVEGDQRDRETGGGRRA